MSPMEKLQQPESGLWSDDQYNQLNNETKATTENIDTNAEENDLTVQPLSNHLLSDDSICTIHSTVSYPELPMNSIASSPTTFASEPIKSSHRGTENSTMAPTETETTVTEDSLDKTNTIQTRNNKRSRKKRSQRRKKEEMQNDNSANKDENHVSEDNNLSVADKDLQNLLKKGKIYNKHQGKNSSSNAGKNTKNKTGVQKTSNQNSEKSYSKTAISKMSLEQLRSLVRIPTTLYPSLEELEISDSVNEFNCPFEELDKWFCKTYVQEIDKPIPKFIEKKHNQVCKFWQNGRCDKGAECKYLHVGEQIRKDEICKFYLNGCCLKGESCLFSHDLKKVPCRFYQVGKCDNPNCRFGHFIIQKETENNAQQQLKQ